MICLYIASAPRMRRGRSRRNAARAHILLHCVTVRIFHFVPKPLLRFRRLLVVLLIAILPDSYSAEVRLIALYCSIVYFSSGRPTLSNPLFQTMMRGAPLFEEQAAIAATHEQTRQFVPQIEDVVDIHSLLESVTTVATSAATESSSARAAAPSCDSWDLNHEFNLCVVTNAGTRSAYAGIHSADVTACSNCLN